MRRVYACLAIVGLVVPYWFFGSFIAAHGLDVVLFGRELIASPASTFFVADVVLTAVAFLVFSWTEAARCKMPRWWPYLVATLLVGPSFAIPVFLYFREKRFAPIDAETVGLGVKIQMR